MKKIEILRSEITFVMYMKRDELKKKPIFKCLGRGRFPGKRVFFLGQLLKKMVWHSFGVDEFPKMHYF